MTKYRRTHNNTKDLIDTIIGATGFFGVVVILLLLFLDVI